MKKINTAILLFLFSVLTFAQSGGKYKASETGEGEYLRAVIVFAQFSDDEKTNGVWQKNKLPNWAFDFIDTEVKKEYRKFTLSDYWRQMSLGKFNFIGDVYPRLVTIQSENYYKNKRADYEEANQDVLKEIDPLVNFRKYDNWKYIPEDKSFVFDEQNGDGFVDLIIIIYREPDKWFGGHYGAFTAISSFGKDFITNDDEIIVKGKLREKASGITVRQGFRGKIDLLERVSHELGHYYFGYAHTNTGGVMGSDTYALSGWERIKLGYVEPIVADKNEFEVTLDDYISTGDILKIPIPFDDPDSENYYLVENHQRISPYDQIARGGELEGRHNFETKMGSGIYIWLIRRGNSFPPIVEAKTADGSWDWELADTIKMPKGWPEIMPIAKRVAVNRIEGTSDRSKKVVEFPSKNKWWELWHDTNVFGEYILTRDKMGDETDAFNIGYNEIFSSWSNPSSVYNEYDNISVQLVEQKGNKIKLKVFTDKKSALELPPSKPQFLRVVKDAEAINLKWELNIEPDIKEYEIWRKINNKEYEQLTSTKKDVFEYLDSDIQDKKNVKTIIYKLRAKDESGKYSVFGDEAGIDLRKK